MKCQLIGWTLTWFRRWFVTLFHGVLEELFLITNRRLHEITRMRWGSLSKLLQKTLAYQSNVGADDTAIATCNKQ